MQQIPRFYGSSCEEWTTLSEGFVPHQSCIYMVFNSLVQFHRYIGRYGWKLLLKIFPWRENGHHHHPPKNQSKVCKVFIDYIWWFRDADLNCYEQ